MVRHTVFGHPPKTRLSKNPVLQALPTAKNADSKCCQKVDIQHPVLRGMPGKYGTSYCGPMRPNAAQRGPLRPTSHATLVHQSSCVKPLTPHLSTKVPASNSSRHTCPHNFHMKPAAAQCGPTRPVEAHPSRHTCPPKVPA